MLVSELEKKAEKRIRAASRPNSSSVDKLSKKGGFPLNKAPMLKQAAAHIKRLDKGLLREHKFDDKFAAKIRQHQHQKTRDNKANCALPAPTVATAAPE